MILKLNSMFILKRIESYGKESYLAASIGNGLIWTEDPLDKAILKINGFDMKLVKPYMEKFHPGFRYEPKRVGT